MGLSLYDIKKIVNPKRMDSVSDDFRIIDSWAEFEDSKGNAAERKLSYLCYELEMISPETGEKYHYYKAMKFCRVIRLPKSAKQSTSFMAMHEQVLAAVYESKINLVTIIANIIEPVALGLLYLYGVQGTGFSIDEAKKKAHYDYRGFIAAMQGTYRVLEMRGINAQETEWLREKMFNMDYITVVRGIPKANEGGEDAGNKGIGGKNLNPDSQGTLEEIITGMADYEYVIQVLSTPVSLSTLSSWQTKTEKTMTEWYGQLQGTKAFSMSLSIPMMFMSNQTQSQGWNKAYTNAESVSHSQGESFSSSYGENVGQALSRSFGQSYSQSQGQSVTDSMSQSHSISHGQSIGQSFSQSISHGQSLSHSVSQGQSFSQGINQGQSLSQSMNQGQSLTQSANQSQSLSQGINQGQSLTQSANQSQSLSHNVNQGQSLNQGISEGRSLSYSEGANASHSIGQSQGQSYNLTQGQSINVGHNVGTNQSISASTSQNTSIGNSASVGQNASQSFSNSWNSSHSSGTNGSFSENQSHSSNFSSSRSGQWSDSYSNGANSGSNSGLSGGFFGVGGNIGGSAGTSDGESHSTGGSISSSYGYGDSYGYSQSQGYSSSDSYGSGVTSGASLGSSSSVSESMTMSNGVSQGQSWGASEGWSSSQGQSLSQGWGANVSSNESISVGNSVNQGWGQSIGRNMSQGLSYSEGMSQGQTLGTGISAGQTFGSSLSQGQTLGSGISAGQTFGSGISQGTTLGSSATAGQSYSVGVTRGESLSESITQGRSFSESITEGYSLSEGRSVGQSYSESVGQTASTGNTESYGQSQSIGQGTSYAQGTTSSQGMSAGASGAVASGISSSMGLGPSIGYNKSYQWLDQQVKDILELLEFSNNRIKKALRGAGAFYTYVYIACPNLDALAAAQTVAKSTWQNEYAMISPLQVMNLTSEEQKHLLHHFVAFSTDVSRIRVNGSEEYKYCTILLPGEFCAYTHLPRVGEGGIFTEANDVPKFAVPSMLKGEIYMGTILSAERYTEKNGYMTPYDYRISEKELMHGFFTGASRSGKTVAAMRFVAELANIRRSSTGKRLRIVVMDPKQDWRTLARFIEPERFHFHSLGRTDFMPIKINPLKIPHGVEPQFWIDGLIDIYCRAYGLLERGKQILGETIYALYEKAGVFEAREKPDWKDLVPEKSKTVTFNAVYKRMEQIKVDLEDAKNPKGKAGNDTRDAYARILDRLQAFNRKFSIEYQLYGTSDGIGIDELIGKDDVTVLESKGLENTFKNFIFGIITSGFYKWAIAHEGGYLAEDQYETVLVIEEANEVLTGNDAAGTGGGSATGLSMSGQSEFEQILDQSAGYGLFIFSITQTIANMPKSVIANSGLIFAGKLKSQDDITVVIRSIAREERYDDRELVKWFPRSPTGWFVCQSSRGYDFKDAEPILVKIARLNINPPTNAEIESILTKNRAREAEMRRKRGSLASA